MQTLEITLQVNGQAHKLQVPPDATLLHVLREQLGLGSVREGCGIGMCGTCTVLLDGKAVSSCLLLAVQAASSEPSPSAERSKAKAITTLEGLEQNGTLHPVQQAFLDKAAFQCAFCTSGFILSTVALLSENPSPSEEEIREYFSGNLCRCGSHENILKAVLSCASALEKKEAD